VGSEEQTELSTIRESQERIDSAEGVPEAIVSDERSFVNTTIGVVRAEVDQLPGLVIRFICGWEQGP
jgi:hypothetical protein